MVDKVEAADVVTTEEGHNGITVKMLMETLSKFSPDTVVIISAKMPMDMEDPENMSLSPDELEEASTIEVGIDSIEEIEYEDSEAKSVVGIFVDIASVIDDEDDEDDEPIDEGDED